MSVCTSAAQCRIGNSLIFCCLVKKKLRLKFPSLLSSACTFCKDFFFMSCNWCGVLFFQRCSNLSNNLQNVLLLLLWHLIFLENRGWSFTFYLLVVFANRSIIATIAHTFEKGNKTKPKLNLSTEGCYRKRVFDTQ